MDQVQTPYIVFGWLLVGIKHRRDAGEQMLRTGEEGVAHLLDLSSGCILRYGYQFQAGPSGLDDLAIVHELLRDGLDQLARTVYVIRHSSPVLFNRLDFRAVSLFVVSQQSVPDRWPEHCHTGGK